MGLIAAGAPPRTAIIDIGSNSIRLVVYQGPPRLPAIIFNEKVLAGLGRSLAATGSIDAAAMRAAETALARFAAVAREMKVGTLRTVATAAVRDASNGADLLAHAKRLKLTVELLSGEDEAVAAGHGVLSGIPQADGIVGDLGGGSLELIRIRRGAVGERASFPLGVLRLAALPDRRGKGAERHIARLLDTAGWHGAGEGLPFYLVGGSWRALARLDMFQQRYPLPIIHQYPLPKTRIAQLARTVPKLDRLALKEVPGLSSERSSTLADAATLLDVVVRLLGSSGAVASAFGLREGLLFSALDVRTRAQDPLAIAARDEGELMGRFPEHGDLLDRWIAPLFAGEPESLHRIRHVACHLADVGWRANPEFRAERGLEIALHGNWVAIEAAERAMIAQALFTSLGGGTGSPDPLPALGTPAQLRTATAWGLAMRLGQRLSGGLAGPLKRTSLVAEADTIRLALTATDQNLYGDTVQKRHAALAQFLGLRAAA